MEKNAQLQAIENYIHDRFQYEPTGHDYFHMKRVSKVARSIAVAENANPFICEAAGWLHDIGDAKLFPDPEKAKREMLHFLQSIRMNETDLQAILHAIETVSFSKGNQIPETLEGKIVQDADRVDAIGAIGIARTFAYGAAKGQLMHHDEKSENTSLQHFFDKLLKLKDLFHTETAKKLAMDRHEYMIGFVAQFLREWI